MPRNKDLKRLVRARMQKTGEAYTAARAQIMKKGRTRSASKSAATSSPASKPVDYASRAGMSDATIEKNTGRPWADWV